MKKKFKGVLTVFLSLVMLLFLSFCLVLAEGSRMYFFRAAAEQAVSLAEFSVLSEYSPELLEKYGLFFLDLDYGQEKEEPIVLHNRLKSYLLENAGEVASYSLNVGRFRRATDGSGSAFFRQAVEDEKFRSGVGFVEELLPDIEEDTVNFNIEEEISGHEEEAEAILSGLTDEDGKPLFHISVPHVTFPGADALLSAVLGGEAGVSEEQIELSGRILNRQLREGTGEESRKSFMDRQLFHRYVLEHCGYYGKRISQDVENVPEYQVEYVIAGEGDDRANLKQVIWKIFLLRAAEDYIFCHQDEDALLKADALSAAAVGVTGNAALVGAVRELFLLKQAAEDGMRETKELLQGKKVPLYREGVFSRIEMEYEDYLRIFLQMTGERDEICRCMDIVELEVRKLSERESFRLDHCTDCFETEWTYEFDSLFLSIPLLDGGRYRNKLVRKMFYEM